MSNFRDPIHGYIYVSELEKKIIDSPPFQRLRNIYQLATTYLIYHGAEHTRFGHSLGVMHLVTCAFDSIVSKNDCLFRDNKKENEAVVIWYRQILRLIALLHDVGHAPFSHASEDLFPEGRKHEDYTKEIIEKTVISEYIIKIGLKLHQEIAESFNISCEDLEMKYNIRPITPQLLWTIYGENPDPMTNNYIWPDFVLLKSFMDGELDCDKMDYLLRDSYYCGVSYGKYDLDRLIASLTVYKDSRSKILQLAIKSGGVQAFEEFVLARYFMFIQVYFHKTRRYFDRLLIKALQEILPDGKYPENVTEYLKWDDIQIIDMMRKCEGTYSKEYLGRESMMCIRETAAHADASDIKLWHSICNRINRDKNVEVVLFDEIDKKAHKLIPFAPENESGVDVKVIDRYTGDARSVMEDSRILQGIVDKIWIGRVYTEECNKEEVNKRIDIELG